MGSAMVALAASARYRPAMRVLIVGAGAVGQAYGYFLQRGGAEVWFYVKPRHKEEVEAGFRLTLLPRGRGRPTITWKADGVTTEPIDADVVLLSVASPALAGDWLEAVCGGAPQATVVTLQPGLADGARVQTVAGPGRVVRGFITLVAYMAPLPGEQDIEGGLALWFPPLSKAPLSGPDERVRPVLEVLRRGGFPITRHPDLTRLAPFPMAAFSATMLGLEAAGWSLATLGADLRLLQTIAGAMEEAVEIAAASSGFTPPVWTRLLGVWGLRALVFGAPRVAPFDMETYLRVHFTKVRDQTHEAGRFLVREGERLGIDSTNLGELLRKAG